MLHAQHKLHAWLGQALHDKVTGLKVKTEANWSDHTCTASLGSQGAVRGSGVEVRATAPPPKIRKKGTPASLAVRQEYKCTPALPLNSSLASE